MRRREFIATLGGGLAWPLVAQGQQSNSKRLAIFSPSESSTLMHEHSENRYYRLLFEELRRLGWVEGQNLTVEGYGREQNTSGLDVLATEIVRRNPDVIYTVGPGAVSFKSATSRIPVVALTGDPVALGIAESLAHPGGNFTGVSIDTGPSIHGKRIALLREMFPAMSKLGCLALRFQWNGPVAGPGIRAAAESIGPASRCVFTRIWRERSRLPGGDRERLPRRCKCNHGGQLGRRLSKQQADCKVGRRIQASFDFYVF